MVTHRSSWPRSCSSPPTPSPAPSTTATSTSPPTGFPQYVVLANAWNILGGYTGYVNFGTGGFFALGVYTSVFLIRAVNAPLLVQIAAGGLVAGLLGLGIGYLTAAPARRLLLDLDAGAGRRARDHDGQLGVRGRRARRERHPSRPYGALRQLCLVPLRCHGAAGDGRGRGSVVHRALEDRRGFAAIRDNEEAAECMGVPTLRLKLLATTVSGALMGIAGAPFPTTSRSWISAFNLSYAVNSLAMPMVGGTTRGWAR